MSHSYGKGTRVNRKTATKMTTKFDTKADDVVGVVMHLSQNLFPKIPFKSAMNINKPIFFFMNSDGSPQCPAALLATKDRIAMNGHQNQGTFCTLSNAVAT